MLSLNNFELNVVFYSNWNSHYARILSKQNENVIKKVFEKNGGAVPVEQV